MQEIAPGIWHWTTEHPRIRLEVSSYYLSAPAVLIDPLARGDVPDRLEELGPPREIVLTNRHHFRDCQALTERFGTPVHVPRNGLHEFGSGEEVEPYDAGDELAGGALVVHGVGAISPDEHALFAPAERALAVADGVIHYGEELSFVPDDLMDQPEETRQRLRNAFARLAERLDFDHLLTAHGDPVVGAGREALRSFAAA